MDLITIDTETGGLHPSVHPLLSIGACCSWSLDKFSGYITPESQPGKSIDPAAARVNGYSFEKWRSRGARAVGQVLADFIRWLGERKKERPAAGLVCHHLAFDKAFLHEAARISCLELPHRNDWRCSQVEMGRLMDVGLIARGSSSLHRLSELSGWQGGRNPEHDALEDALMTQHGYQWLIKVAKRPEVTLRELYNESLKQRRNLESLICEVEFYMTSNCPDDQVTLVTRLIGEAAKVRARSAAD